MQRQQSCRDVAANVEHRISFGPMVVGYMGSDERYPAELPQALSRPSEQRRHNEQHRRRGVNGLTYVLGAGVRS